MIDTGRQYMSHMCSNMLDEGFLDMKSCQALQTSSATLCRDNAIPLATSHVPSLSREKKREALQAAVEHILAKGKLQLQCL